MYLQANFDKENSSLMGVDASFSRTGISVLDFKNKKIYFTRIGVKMQVEKTFKNVYFDAETLIRSLELYLGEMGLEKALPEHVIIEAPIPNGIWSGGLYMLLSKIVDTFLRCNNVKGIYAASPTYLRKFHAKKKYNKSDSVELALKFLQVFQDHNYEIKIKTAKICHDEAEAFLYLCYLFVSFFEEENEISMKLKQICPGIGYLPTKIQKIM